MARQHGETLSCCVVKEDEGVMGQKKAGVA